MLQEIQCKQVSVSVVECHQRTFEQLTRDQLLGISAPVYDSEQKSEQEVEEDVLEKSGEYLSDEGRLLRAIVEAIPDMIFVKEAQELRFVRLNRAGEELLGYSRSELFGKNDFDFFPASEAEAFVAKDREVLKSRQQVDIPEEPIQTQKGPRTLRTKKVPIFDEQGRPKYLLGISEDITEQLRTKLELQKTKDDLGAARLREAQKLELLGVVAGGVSHDFNNLLVGILGNISLLQEEDSLSEGQRELALRIEGAARRASELSRQILAYSGKGQMVATPTDLSHLLRELVTLLESSVDKKTRLIVEAPALAAIDADASQIRQLFMNLITNASESLDGNPGTVKVTVFRQFFSEQDSAAEWLLGSVQSGEYLCIDVEDQGKGMSSQTQERILEPFYSTKKNGHGLGLAAVSGIILGHRGAMKLESTEGKGTTFTVALPSTSRTVAAVMPTSTAGTLGATRILVIDDEPTVRQVARRALERGGAIVQTASNGREGLEAFAHASDGFDLVLLDLSMPELDGRQVFEQIRATHPECPVVFSSGYNEGESGLMSDELMAFLQKPYSAPELIAALESILEVSRRKSSVSSLSGPKSSD
ncbi:MAG: response regulator [Polyangiaceae bacterium]|nr:response regulator [Polyangiaceae bacterium]